MLAVASAQHIKNTEVSAAFSAGKSFRFLAAHEMARVLGPGSYIALFHVFLALTQSRALEAGVKGMLGIH